MGETRDPRLGQWSIFEGDEHVTDFVSSVPYADINRPLVFPITLRVHRIRGRVMESQDIEIDEDYEVTVKPRDSLQLDELRLDGGL